MGIPGLICSIIGLQLYRKDDVLYKTNQGMYEEKDYNNLKTGRILCIIGIVISVIILLISLYKIMTLGVDGYMQQIENLNSSMENQN